MRTKTQAVLFGWSLTLALGLGALAVYYYYSAGTVQTTAFTQAFWGFVAATLFTLLVSLQPTRPLPAAAGAAAPITPPAPAQGAAEPTEIGQRPAPGRMPALPPGASRVWAHRYPASNDVASGRPMPSTALEQTLAQLASADSALEPSPAPSPAALREMRHRLRALLLERVPLPSKARPLDTSVDGIPASEPDADESPGDPRQYWQSRDESSREALDNLWRLYEDAEAEIAELQSRIPERP